MFEQLKSALSGAEAILSERTPEQAAGAEVEFYGARELELLSERQAKLAELAAAKEQAGNAYLDGGKNAIGRVLRITAEAEAIGRAIGVCHNRRLEAVAKRLQARVEALRQQASDKRAELADMERKTEKLLAALSEAEGVRYTAAVLAAQPAGDFGATHIPRSVSLRTEAEALENKAADIERAGVPQRGGVDLEGTSTEDLLAALLRHEGQIPPVDAVLKWATDCEAAVAPRKLADFSRRFCLSWDAAGSILPASYIYCRALGPELATLRAS